MVTGSTKPREITMFAVRIARQTLPTNFIRKLFGKIFEADCRYRQMRKLSDMSDERLLDMGISRASIRSAFLP